jgi:DNA polymerase (family 10)
VLGLPWIPPELREDRGEFELEKVPELIDYKDIRGDLHIHSNYSDGTNSIKEIAEFAKSLGYEYIAITDHSKTARYAGGIDEKRLEEEMVEIDRVQSEVGIRIFKGIELEILKDGRLDFDDNILRKLDVVIGAVHIFSKQDMTEAILKACSNPNVDVIAHPTGRLISRREGYRIDINKIIKHAASTNTALEINSYYDRLDLSDVNAKKAKENGVKIILGSDAHNLRMMKGMRFGVGIARRAWLSKSGVLNSLPADRFETWLKKREIDFQKTKQLAAKIAGDCGISNA